MATCFRHTHNGPYLRVVREIAKELVKKHHGVQVFHKDMIPQNLYGYLFSRFGRDSFTRSQIYLFIEQ